MLVNDPRRPARARGARSLVGALVGILLLAGCASRPATISGGGGLTPSPGQLPVIGFLSTAGGPSPVLEAFLDGLRELGYEDGHNVRIEYRWAKGDVDALPALAAELVRLP